MINNLKRKPDPTRQRRLAGHYLRGSASDTARLQRTVSLAARALGFPRAQLNIIDDRDVFVLAGYHHQGVTGAVAVPRAETVCQFVLEDGLAMLAVDDLREREPYRRLPCVTQGMAVSYLGVPLTSREASTVGTLCVFDDRPREITAADMQRLAEFGEIVEDQLDLIRRSVETAASREISALVAEALEAGDIVPWYQPVITLGTGGLRAFEALARWQRPDGSVVSPAGFLAAVEDSDLVVDVDRAVARAAMIDLARWRRTKPELLTSINLSTRHLELPDGASFVIATAEDVGLDPSALVVEITETRMLYDIPRATAILRELQAAGFRILLDDFANGWSSLDWLMDLGADGIKIALGTRVGDAVCRALVQMAGELGLTTTIEGIETEQHLAATRSHGFQYGQGYHWSAPVPAVVVDATI